MIYLIIVLAIALFISLYFNWRYHKGYPFGENVKPIVLGKDLIEITYYIEEANSTDKKTQAPGYNPILSVYDQTSTYLTKNDCNQRLDSVDSYFLLCPPVTARENDRPPPGGTKPVLKIGTIKIIKNSNVFIKGFK